MTIDIDRLLNWQFGECVQTYNVRDTMFYALSIGIGGEPQNQSQLKFVYEDRLVALPTLPMILGWPGLWFSDPATGIDASAVVNAAQALVVQAPVPVAGTIRSQTRIVNVFDRGAGRGALIHLERQIRDHTRDCLIATVRSSLLCRRDGGFGGPPEPHGPITAIPDREPDHVVELPTLPQAHLLYRLNGDFHPLHVDPDAARSAGFSGPLLHGLATFGIAGYALLKTICHHQPERLRAIGMRFSAPFFPGETLAVELWRHGTEVSFRAWARERNVKVLDRGFASVDVSSDTTIGN